MLLHGTLVGTVPVAVPEHWVAPGANPVQLEVEVLGEGPSEFPVEKITFPDSSLAGPAPDIQIEDRKRKVELGCLSSSWFAGSPLRVVPFQLHPKSQPRDWLGTAATSQKLVKAA
jgi:hypothetical protein